jgi:hypothetical protein
LQRYGGSRRQVQFLGSDHSPSKSQGIVRGPMYLKVGRIVLLAGMVLLSRQDLYGQSFSPGTSHRASHSFGRSYSPRSRAPTYSSHRHAYSSGTASHARPHTYRRTHSHRARPARSYRAHAHVSPGGRDHRGRLSRSAAAKDAFMRSTGHSRGWPGHVVDHRVALACGGADTPSNMQWQTTEAAREKDRFERRGCHRSRH